MSIIQEGIAREHPEWVLPRLCEKNANKTGVYVAVVTVFISLPLARKVGLNKNRALLSALTASALGGYFSSKYSYTRCKKTYDFLQSMEKNVQLEQENKL